MHPSLVFIPVLQLSFIIKSIEKVLEESKGIDPLHCLAWPQVNFGCHGPLKLFLLRSLRTAMLLNPAAIFQFSSWLLKNSRLCWLLPSFATSSWSLSPALLVCPAHPSQEFFPNSLHTQPNRASLELQGQWFTLIIPNFSADLSSEPQSPGSNCLLIHTV